MLGHLVLPHGCLNARNLTCGATGSQEDRCLFPIIDDSVSQALPGCNLFLCFFTTSVFTGGTADAAMANSSIFLSDAHSCGFRRCRPAVPI